MILVFDPKTLSLQVKVGTLEEYKPTEEIKELQKESEEILKMVVEFREKQLDPRVKELMAKVEELNKPYMPEKV